MFHAVDRTESVRVKKMRKHQKTPAYPPNRHTTAGRRDFRHRLPQKGEANHVTNRDQLWHKHALYVDRFETLIVESRSFRLRSTISTCVTQPNLDTAVQTSSEFIGIACHRCDFAETRYVDYMV